MKTLFISLLVSLMILVAAPAVFATYYLDYTDADNEDNIMFVKYHDKSGHHFQLGGEVVSMQKAFKASFKKVNGRWVAENISALVKADQALEEATNEALGYPKNNDDGVMLGHIIRLFVIRVSEGKFNFAKTDRKTPTENEKILDNYTCKELKRAIKFGVKVCEGSFMDDFQTPNSRYFMRDAKTTKDFPETVRERAYYVEVVERLPNGKKRIDSRLILCEDGEILYFPTKPIPSSEKEMSETAAH